jgi:hypothetical protein
MGLGARTLPLAAHRFEREETWHQMIERASPKDLHLVVLECPIENWNNPTVRRLFNELVSLKMLGFSHHYRAKVLPVDTTDFIGHHVLTCLSGPDGLQPIAGFRAVDLHRCQSFNQSFPAESLARSANARRHTEAVRGYIERCDSVGYIGSWTVHPTVRRNRPLRAAIRDHFALGGILLHDTIGVERIILGATLRFKVDRLLAPVGYRALSHEEERLGPLAASHLHGELVQLMHLDRVSDRAMTHAEPLREDWDLRMVF